MAQAVERDAQTLAPLPATAAPANSPEMLALADSGLLCLAQLCAAAASAGWPGPAPHEHSSVYQESSY